MGERLNFRLMPRDESFFNLLEKASENVDRASKLLVDTLRDPRDLDLSARQMKGIEEEGDGIVHNVMEKLHGTFITPLDREDIHDLISALDDVLDFIEAATDRFSLYRANTMRAGAVELAEIISRQAAEIQQMMRLLRRLPRNEILQHCVEINRLENAADGTLRKALEELFGSQPEAIQVIQWRELYDLLESATDKAEDVADVVEGIVLKNA
jgi:predicted phosphate transport protein (TIGR00153 family)